MGGELFHTEVGVVGTFCSLQAHNAGIMAMNHAGFSMTTLSARGNHRIEPTSLLSCS